MPVGGFPRTSGDPTTHVRLKVREATTTASGSRTPGVYAAARVRRRNVFAKTSLTSDTLEPLDCEAWVGMTVREGDVTEEEATKLFTAINVPEQKAK